MRFTADDGDFVELGLAEPPGWSGDLHLQLQLRRRGFSATINAWVAQQAWHAFAQELTILEETRRGEARLDGMSPGELSLAVRSVDTLGHMGIEGAIGHRSFDGEVSLSFSVFSFDPSQLVASAREARDISGQIGKKA